MLDSYDGARKDTKRQRGNGRHRVDGLGIGSSCQTAPWPCGEQDRGGHARVLSCRRRSSGYLDWIPAKLTTDISRACWPAGRPSSMPHAPSGIFVSFGVVSTPTAPSFLLSSACGCVRLHPTFPEIAKRALSGQRLGERGHHHERRPPAPPSAGCHRRTRGSRGVASVYELSCDPAWLCTAVRTR